MNSKARNNLVVLTVALSVACTNVVAATIADGYRQLDSVRFTGTQYIDLRQPLSGNQRVEIVYTVESEGAQFVFGARGSSSTDRNFVHMLTGDSLVLDLCDTKESGVVEGNGRDLVSRQRLGRKVHLVHGAKLRSVTYEGDDEDQTVKFERSLKSDFVTSGNCYLGSANSTLSGYSGFKGRIYSFRIVDGVTGLAVKDLVPCLEESSNRVGFYDAKSEDSGTAFFGNAGTGELIPGRVLPVDMPECEIEENGRSARLSVRPEDCERTVYLSCGMNDSWYLTNSWDSVVRVATLPSGQSHLSFDLPAGYGTTYHVIRAFVESATSDGFSSLDYVKDGLVLMYDAKDNAGVKTHDASSYTWKDLSGSGYDMSLPSDRTEVGNDAIGFRYIGSGAVWSGSQRPQVAVAALSTQGPKTVETVAWTDQSFDDTTIVGSTDRMDVLYVGNHGTIAFANSPWEYVSGQHLIAVFDEGLKGHFHANATSSFNEIASLKERQTYSAFFSPLDYSASAMSVNGSDYVRSGVSQDLHVVDMTRENKFILGLNRANSYYSAIRLYNRKLSAAERSWNCMVDAVRYRRKALVASNPCYAKATLSVLAVNKSRGVPVSARVAVDGKDCSGVKRKLYLAWGRDDAGDKLERWERSCYLQDVPDGTSVLEVPFPAEMIESMGDKGGIRLFLRDAEAFDVMDYVQDGLILHLDAKSNSGVGIHADFPEAWKDLSGHGNDMGLPVGHTDARAEQMRFAYGGGEGSWSGQYRPKVDIAELRDLRAKTVEVVAHTDSSIESSVAAVAERMDFLYMGNYGTFAFSTYSSKHLIGTFAENQGGTLVGRYLTDESSSFNDLSSIKTLKSYSGVLDPTSRQNSDLRVDGLPYVSGSDAEWKSTAMTDEYQVILGLNRADVNYSSVRIYNRKLSDEERAWNEKVDQVRYRGGCLSSDYVGIKTPGLIVVFR